MAAVLRHLNHPYSSCTNWFLPPDSQPNSPPSLIQDDSEIPRHETFPLSGHVIGKGQGFMNNFHADKFAEHRAQNIYYPFASRDEWELGAFLSQADISMKATDEFLSLGRVSPRLLDLPWPVLFLLYDRQIRRLGLSFKTAKTLRALVELLPGGPKWVSQEIHIPDYSTKAPIVVYYRDPIECVKWILQNPIYSNRLRYSPERRSTPDGNREYGDWITSDGAWFMQVRSRCPFLERSDLKPKAQLPPGSTLLGVTLSSDKTMLSAMSGDRVAHPLLITLANLDSDTRMKSSYGALQLLALLPVPKFVGVPGLLCGVLENRVIHACLDLICLPLKIVARSGLRMADSFGDVRHCYTPLVGYIADTPEATALACVSGKTSHLTMAFGSQFGDEFPHPPRTADQVLTSLSTLSSYIDPWNLAPYVREARESFRLNGVDLPFWRDWTLPTGVLPDPYRLFPIEVLHHFHKYFWDHDLKWCIRALGEGEIDFRFSLLQPRCGSRHFSSGISKLKQVTGREHRHLQRYILGVIAGAAPAEFVLAIRALLDLRYLAQMQRVDTTVLEEIAAALRTFHHYKQVILDNRYRVGTKKPINHFEIPKLELLQSVVPCIQWSGALPQWSADRTEYSHIDFIKRPKSKTNGHDYSSQICRHLDRAEKIHFFDLATGILESLAEGVDDPSSSDLDDDAMAHEPEGSWLSKLPTLRPVDGTRRPIPDFFNAQPPPSHLPSALHRTFIVNETAFRLNVKPNVTRTPVDDAAIEFNIPDLQLSISDWFIDYLSNPTTRTISGRQGSAHDVQLPFMDIRVWHSVQVQNHDAAGGLRRPQRLFAQPPSHDWPFGRCDTALFREAIDRGPDRPGYGLDGLIFFKL